MSLPFFGVPDLVETWMALDVGFRPDADIHKLRTGANDVTSIDVLRDEYPGDVAWAKYVEAVCKGSDSPRQFAVLENIDAETARVVTASFGERASEWWISPVRALDNLAPSEVYHRAPQGGMILRSLLMRLP